MTDWLPSDLCRRSRKGAGGEGGAEGKGVWGHITLIPLPVEKGVRRAKGLGTCHSHPSVGTCVLPSSQTPKPRGPAGRETATPLALVSPM